MENAYEFMLKYMDYLSIAEENGYKIPDEFHKPIEFYKEIESRAEGLTPYQEDDLYKACRKMQRLFSSDKDVYRAFLEYWGIQEKPYKVFYRHKHHVPCRKYVIAFFIQIDEDIEYPRNEGNGERYYGSGESETSEEFWEEIKACYAEDNTTELCEISEVYTEPEAFLYEYNGYLYKEFI